MFSRLYTASASGIPEGLAEVISVSDFIIVAIVFGGTIITVGLIYAVGYFTEDYIGGYSVIAAFAVGLSAIFFLGSFTFNSVQDIEEQSKESVRAATRQNIEENFELQDLQIENIDRYGSTNTTKVSGSVDGVFISFTLKYSGEHDLMVPVKSAEGLPIRDDSELDKVLSSGDASGGDSSEDDATNDESTISEE